MKTRILNALNYGERVSADMLLDRVELCDGSLCEYYSVLRGLIDQGSIDLVDASDRFFVLKEKPCSHS